MELYEALGAKLIKSSPIKVELHQDFNEHFNVIGELEVPSYIIEFPNGKLCMLVPIRRYKEGLIAESWAISPKPDDAFNDVLDIMLLRDDQWVCLLKKPDKAEKWPTALVQDVVKHSSLLEPCNRLPPDHVMVSIAIPYKFTSETCEIKLNELGSVIESLRAGNHNEFADVLTRILENSKL